MRSEVENIVATVNFRVHDAIWSAMDDLIIYRMELAKRSIDIPLTRNPNSALLNPDQRDFSEDTNGLKLVTSSRCHSNINFDRIDVTRGNITIEKGHLLSSERLFDRETHAYHMT